MKFSVLLPTWNRALHLPNAIQSILDQTVQDWELVIVDDGSVDDTVNVVSRFTDKRIKYFKIPHCGLVKALNFGTSKCKGQIIVKQDSDDASLPNRLEVIKKNMTTDFFYHGMYQMWELEGKLMRAYRPAEPLDLKRIVREQYIPGAYAYTKKFAEETPYRELFMSEDWMLILDAIYKGKSIGSVNQGLYEYSLQKDSNSLINRNRIDDDEKTIKQILETEYGIKDFSYPRG